MRHPVVTLGCLISSFVLLSVSSSQAENWAGWRGPRGDGTSTEKNVPTEWYGEKNVAWKTELPGIGHASPIVFKDRIFTVSAITDKEERALLCLDRKTGKILWQKDVLKSPLEKKHRLNSFASSTPATDGELVYTAFLDQDDMVVAAFDYDGNQKWMVRPGEFHSRHGFCSCPILYKDMVIVNGDHDGDSYIVALDRKTGETRWKTMREYKTRSYCTPIIREIDGRTQMILSGSKCVASYDPNDGSKHWMMDGPTEQFVASPVYSHDLLFITAGFPEFHIITLRPTGKGKISPDEIVWRTIKGAGYVPSPIAVGDYFLNVSDNGIGSQFEAKTGNQIWQARLGKHFSASAVSANGLAYFTSDDGITTVIKPSDKLEIVAENKLGEECYSSPAISQGQIFIRGVKHLYAIGKE